MSFWVPLVAALLGSGIGGGIALFAGLRADLRRRRDSRDEQIRELTAALGAATRDFAAWVHDAPNVAQAGSSGFKAMADAIERFNRAVIHLRWLVTFSPLYDQVLAVDRAANDLLGERIKGSEEFDSQTAQIHGLVETLEESVGWYTDLPPAARVAYMRSVKRIVEPPAGCRPVGWPTLVDGKTRFRFWRQTFFKE